MRKKLWAVVLAAAVTVTSAVPVSYAGIQVQAATKKPTTSSTTGVQDTSTDGRTTAAGYIYSVVGSEATITGYSGIAKDLTIPTKIVYTKTETVLVPATAPAGATKATKAATAAKATTAPKPTTATDATQPTNATTATDATQPTSAITPTTATIGYQAVEQTTTKEYNVTAIANNTFSGQLGIQSVTMSGGTDTAGKSYGIKTIGEKAFFACHDLTKITIAATTSSIGNYAFADCVSLDSITVGEGNQRYKVVDGSLYSYSAASGTGAYTLEQYSLGNKAEAFTAPDAIAETLTAVGEGAFWGSENLETVTLPGKVKTIGESAYAECRKLKTVNLPDGLATISAEAFKGDVQLNKFTVPSGVTAINTGTFQDCEGLKSINLPDSLAFIGSHAFQGCKSLEEFAVPAGVTMIGDQAFAQCESLKSISIPVRTTSIGNGVFRGTETAILCQSGSQAAVYAMNNGLDVKRTFTVNFYSDQRNTELLSSQSVLEGSDAEPPKVAERKGYKMSWSGSYTNIKQDTRIYPVWTQLYSVTFVDSYNSRTKVVEVEENQMPVPPEWTMQGYILSWDKNLAEAVNGDFTIHALWQNSSTGKPLDPNVVKPEGMGTELTEGNNRYEVISDDIDNPKVKFIGLVQAEVDNVNIPAEITVDEVDYQVTEMPAKVLQGNEHIKTLVINQNIKSISTKAFYKCTKLKKVKLKTKALTKINSKAFGKINEKAVFYTYYSKVSKYKSMLKQSGVKKPTMKQL